MTLGQKGPSGAPSGPRRVQLEGEPQLEQKSNKIFGAPLFCFPRSWPADGETKQNETKRNVINVRSAAKASHSVWIRTPAPAKNVLRQKGLSWLKWIKWLKCFHIFDIPIA